MGEHISGEEFVQLAMQVLGERKRYEDNKVYIEINLDDHLIITRKPMPEIAPHLRGHNPVTMANLSTGIPHIFQHHREHFYLTPHLRSLLKKKI